MTKSDYLQVLTDWNYWGRYKRTSILRKSYVARLARLANIGEIAVVLGIRRSGKSTIICQYLEKLFKERFKEKNTLVINFEDSRLSGITVLDLHKIYDIYLQEQLPDKRHVVVLDEIQEVDKWEKFARFLLEAKGATVIVSGSSGELMSREYATVLTGRHVDMEVFPLSFAEILDFKGLKVGTSIAQVINKELTAYTLKRYLQFGGFPRVVLQKEEEEQSILTAYFNDIIARDIVKRFRVRREVKLIELARFYLTNISSRHSFQQIKRMLDLSLDTIERFSSHFQTARLIGFLPKFAYSLKSQIISQKKAYVFDVGLRRAAGFQFGDDWGRLMENAVWLELVRRGCEIYYAQLGVGEGAKEIDFVVKKGSSVHELIQVCYQMTDFKTRKRELENLAKGSGEFKCDNLTVITDEEEGEEMVKGKKIKIVPIGKWLVA